MLHTELPASHLDSRADGSGPADLKYQGLEPSAALEEANSEQGFIPISSILVEIICFCLAFMSIRHFMKSPRPKGPPRPIKKMCEVSESPKSAATPLQAWRNHKQQGPVHGQDLLKHASRVFSWDPRTFAQEFVAHLEDAGQPAQVREDLHLLLDIPSKCGRPDITTALAQAARDRLGLEVEAVRLHHCMLSAYASSGQEAKVEDMLDQERAQFNNGKVAVRSLAVVARGYLKNGKAQAAFRKLAEMKDSGHEVPHRAVSELFEVAAKTGDVKDILQSLSGKIPVPSDAFGIILEYCFLTEDFDMASSAEKLAKDQGTTLPQEGFESMLKLWVKKEGGKALAVFEAIQEAGFHPCEGLCRYLIARCADSQNLHLAELVATYLRSRDEMSFSCYKTLMKAYAYTGQYNKACDLYAEIKLKGWEPDAVMYGSLIKFAAKAGRVELSHELADKFDGKCIKNYMWLIRSAGQEGDVNRAIATFRKLQEGQPEMVDVMAYNVTLDACVVNKEMERALELLKEMHSTHSMNLVTYNTMIKGHCIIGNLANAQKALREMEVAGIAPDAASFSCLLSGASKAMNFQETLNILDEMDKRRIPLDSYVTSIMMQLSRKLPNKREAMQALAILDRPDVRIFEDEVVFNTVLDACIFRRDLNRLSRAVDGYPDSKIKASIRTYGLLIKACAVLHRTQDCWDFWNELVHSRGLLPNDVTLGCMIDALVEAQKIEDALALFQDFKTKITCDTIIYSTLIKGFASTGDADRAMALYGDMKTNGIQMNHIAFTTLINAHAKNGLMKRAEQLLEEMEKEGCKPNGITYASLIRGHCVRGDLSAALKLFQQMLRCGFQADSVIFNTLLDGCVQHGNFPLADELLVEMQNHNVSPSNYTLSIIVKMWSKRGELDKAFEAVYSALEDPNGPYVDAQVGACIVGSCIHNKAPNRAIEVFNDMKTWPNFDGPDANTYSALISGLPRHGFLTKAVTIAEEACVVLKAKPGHDKQPLAPNALWQLFRALRNERLLDELGHPLAQKLRDAGMQVDDKWLDP